MKTIKEPLLREVDTRFKISDITFVIQDQKNRRVIKPQRYSDLLKTMSKKAVSDLIKEDDLARSILFMHNEHTSFLRASIVGFSKKHDYSGIINENTNTYYFKLTPAEADKCVYRIYRSPQKVSDVMYGIGGMASCLKEWEYLSNSFESEELDDEEVFYPMVEVLIPFKIKPFACFPDESKREYYFCSTEKVDKIEKYSRINMFKTDAAISKVPWEYGDLNLRDEPVNVVGRYPRAFSFKEGIRVPKDFPIYIYKIKNVKTSSVSDKWPWNKLLMEEIEDIEPVEKIKSWQKEFLID